LSTHYYIISLNERTIALFEAFRDVIIDIRNGGFPVEVWLRPEEKADSFDREERLMLALRTVDQHFGDCYRHDPLNLVIVGERDLQDLFTAVTVHRNAIIGRVEGDFSATSMDDLGKIVWPIVKDVISGHLDDAMRDLEIASKARRTVVGLEAVSQLAITGAKAMLLVEDDYHIRGSISGRGQSIEVSRDVDVREEMDDAVDVVIEKILKSGGKVIFSPSGSLESLGRIVLLPFESEDS
jgi:hypothetical protein